MGEEQVVDAEVVEEHGAPQDSQAIVPAVPTPALAVTPQVKAAELGERLTVIKEAMNYAMEQDVDYGKVPGTDKPTLFKPGAEKLSVLFQLDVQLSNEKQWGPGDHLTVISHATVFHAPTGSRLGYGEGVCTTRERKYAYRKKERVCPKCGVEAIIKGKADFGGGWVCWKKKDGCDAKFPDDAPEIVGQEAGEVDNPDLPDLWNTVVKMAEKRARVDAVLAVTGASALFTQDVEDMADARSEAPRETASMASAEKPKTGFASDKQRTFCERLLKEAGFDQQGVSDVCDYLNSKLSRSDISKAIDGLKGEQTRVQVGDELQSAAAAFHEQLAAEDAGAPPPRDPDAEAHDESIPF